MSFAVFIHLGNFHLTNDGQAGEFFAFCKYPAPMFKCINKRGRIGANCEHSEGNVY